MSQLEQQVISIYSKKEKFLIMEITSVCDDEDEIKCSVQNNHESVTYFSTI